MLKESIYKKVISNIAAGLYRDDVKSKLGGYDQEMFGIDQLILAEASDGVLINLKLLRKHTIRR